MTRRLLQLASLFFMVGIGGCSFAPMGATPGGVQDMRLARETIANGMVPFPEAFVVEGMFSEHDLPVAGPPCREALCLRGATGVAPDLDGAPRGWVQLGMSSNVSTETYRRPPARYIAVVDVSGSMGWNTGEASPGELSRRLLHAIVEDLDGDDAFALVTYGTFVETKLGFVSGGRHGEMHGVVDGLGDGGSTNMEAGLERAYSLARDTPSSLPTRVLLFTDVQPNVGLTSADGFESMAAAAAADGIGTTVFGMGFGIGQEVLIAMSHLRGGNAHTVIVPDDVARVMEDGFPFLAHPIANDLVVTVDVSSDGDEAGRAFGFPASDDRDVGLEVKSVFLSRRRGALLLEVAGAPADGFSLEATIRYTALDGSDVDTVVAVGHDGGGLDERGVHFGQPGVGKTTALALLVSGMREAVTLYAADQDAAIARMTTVNARIAADAAALDDPALDPEVALAAELLRLMEQAAPQGDAFVH
jgi:Ca-activated chloride channel family protein